MVDKLPDRLRELHVYVKILDLLLSDPHPGLSTWCIAYAEAMRKMAEFWNNSEESE